MRGYNNSINTIQQTCVHIEVGHWKKYLHVRFNFIVTIWMHI